MDEVPLRASRTSRKEADGLSLALGGLLYQFWRRARLSGDGLQLLPRRVFVMTLLAWLPLLLLAIAEGHAWGQRVLPS